MTTMTFPPSSALPTASTSPFCWCITCESCKTATIPLTMSAAPPVSSALRTPTSSCAASAAVTLLRCLVWEPVERKNSEDIHKAELLTEMKEQEVTPNMVTKYLGQFAFEVLEPLDIEYRTKRTGKSRLIKFLRRDIIKGLELLKRQRERNRDAR